MIIATLRVAASGAGFVCRLPGVLLWGAMLLAISPAVAEVRTWTDDSGKFNVEAEFITAKDGRVRLRRPDGKSLTVALDRLSEQDRAYVEAELSKVNAVDSASAIQELPQIAQQFFEDLRSTERSKARGLLTAKAQQHNPAADEASADQGHKQRKAPLYGLPAPDEGARAIRIGKPKLDGAMAEVPVQVRVGGEAQKTLLHLRQEEGTWRVFALSAKAGDEVRTIDFESVPSANETQNPIEQLVGKKFELEGITLAGGRINMSQYAGKVVLVDFWATWCGPCREEMPNVLANYQQYHDAGFEVIAVSVDEDLDELKKFVVQQSPPWAVVADHHPQNRVSMAARYGVGGIPTFVLVDRDGTVAAVDCRGPRLGVELARLLGNKQANDGG
jgi:thiol-disulfide isomerase/thioredoxin